MTKQISQWGFRGSEDNFAWRWLRYWTTPAVPTSQEIEYLRTLLTKLKEEKRGLDVLILGSTSEYRDLMIELGVHATVVDFSKENYEILSNRMRHFKARPQYETLIQQKWQELKIDKKFDVVLGHFALNVCAYEDWGNILKSIHASLKDDGLFITNNWVRPGNKKIKTSAVLKEYAKKWQKDYDLWSSMMPQIYLGVQNFKNDYIGFDDVCGFIEAGYKNGSILGKDYKIYQNLGYKNFVSFKMFIPDESRFKALVGDYFAVKDVVYFDSYPSAKCIPEWVLVKK